MSWYFKKISPRCRGGQNWSLRSEYRLPTHQYRLHISWKKGCGAGLYCSAEDYAKFVGGYFSNTLLTKESTDLMEEVHTNNVDEDGVADLEGKGASGFVLCIVGT